MILSLLSHTVASISVQYRCVLILCSFTSDLLNFVVLATVYEKLILVYSCIFESICKQTWLIILSYAHFSLQRYAVFRVEMEVVAQTLTLAAAVQDGREATVKLVKLIVTAIIMV